MCREIRDPNTHRQASLLPGDSPPPVSPRRSQSFASLLKPGLAPPRVGPLPLHPRAATNQACGHPDLGFGVLCAAGHFFLHRCHRWLRLTGHSDPSIHGGWIFPRTACAEGRGRGSNWEGCLVPSTRDGACSCPSMRSPPIIEISTSFLIRSPSPDRLPSPLYSFYSFQAS
jgi:hypothetical protein